MSNLQGKGLGTKKFALKPWRERGKNNYLKAGGEGGRGISLFPHASLSRPSLLFIYLEEKFSSL